MGKTLSHHRGEWGRLVLLRHGESTANAAGLFTGILDAPITSRGENEARAAAAALARAQLVPDVIFVSELVRSKRTAELLIESSGRPPEELVADWRLNERNYGALTGRLKKDVAEEFGNQQFRLWRRSLYIRPPAMSEIQHAQFEKMAPFDRLPPEALSYTESLQDVIDRVEPVWTETILPELLAGRTVLVVAHGNSLRALCGVLDRLDGDQLENLNIPTGMPLVYKFDEAMQPDPAGGRYLEPDRAEEAVKRIADEGGT